MDVNTKFKIRRTNKKKGNKAPGVKPRPAPKGLKPCLLNLEAWGRKEEHGGKRRSSSLQMPPSEAKGGPVVKQNGPNHEQKEGFLKEYRWARFET